MMEDQHPMLSGAKTVAFIILMIFACVYLGIMANNAVKEGRYIGRPETERDTITITGEGRVTAIPDIGQITVSIITKGDDAGVAQEENVTQFNQLVADLKAEGIADEDLKTSSYNVYPQYDYIDGERIDAGFEVRQSLTVKIRDLDNAGAIVSIASQNGANQVSNLSFTIDDPEQYRQEARVEALEQARSKAQELADIAGVELGTIVSFSESSGGSIPQPVYREAFALDAAEEGASFTAPQFEAGSQEVTVYATIQYEIY